MDANVWGGVAGVGRLRCGLRSAGLQGAHRFGARRRGFDRVRKEDRVAGRQSTLGQRCFNRPGRIGLVVKVADNSVGMEQWWFDVAVRGRHSGTAEEWRHVHPLGMFPGPGTDRGPPSLPRLHRMYAPKRRGDGILHFHCRGGGALCSVFCQGGRPDPPSERQELVRVGQEELVLGLEASGLASRIDLASRFLLAGKFTNISVGG